MINYLLPLTLTCLFLPFKAQLGVVQIRPFDGMVILLLLASLPRATALLRARISPGFFLVIPFLIVHVLSAFTLSGTNGVRELLQAGLLVTLAFLINSHADRLDYRKAGKVLLVGFFAVMAYNIIWHIGHGFWSGWKRLIDPRAIFTLLPMLLGVILVFTEGRQRQLYWVLWVVTGLAVLFSGERKALLVFVLLSIAFFGRARLQMAAPVAAVGFAGLVLFAGFTDNRYLAKQLDSILEPSTTQMSLGALVEGYVPRSLSNTSREFQMQQSAALISQHPVFGVGTNAYIKRIEQRFASLPRYLRQGVHNEFLRVQVENGIIGFAAYLTIWIGATMRLLRLGKKLRFVGYLDAFRLRLLLITLLVPPFFYVVLEASGTRVITVGIVVSLLPDVLRAAINRYGRYRERIEAGANVDEQVDHLTAKSGSLA